MKIQPKKSFYICFSLFLTLSVIILVQPVWLGHFDATVGNAVRSLPNGIKSFFLTVTTLANPVQAGLILIAIVAWFAYRKYYYEAAWLTAGVVGVAAILNPLIKLIIRRDRPTVEHLVTENSFSFPSGHSLGSMVLYGTLLLIVPVFIKHRATQRIIQILLACLIVSIGVSRVYLGVHFPSDILGGFLLGLTWLTFSYPIYRQQKAQSSC